MAFKLGYALAHYAFLFKFQDLVGSDAVAASCFLRLEGVTNSEDARLQVTFGWYLIKNPKGNISDGLRCCIWRRAENPAKMTHVLAAGGHNSNGYTA